MSDVFLSYKREDAARVQRLHAALVAAGLTVWWDRDLKGGEEFAAAIDHELTNARTVIVFWSVASVGKEGAFVRDEARRGLNRGVLVPVRIDTVALPLGFGEYQTLDLVGWRGGASDARFTDVLATVQALVNQQPRPALRWPSVRRRRNILSLAALALFAGVLAGLMAPATRCTLCTTPVLREVCRITGIGWAERITWPRRSETLSQVVSPKDAFETEQAARSDAQRRGDDYARDTVCAPFAKADWQLSSARALPSEWHCTTTAAGFRCGFSGAALCEVKQKALEFGNTCEQPK